ncbi:CDP-alcohol phosphatidyltransferase family protein [Reyranella soli]|uniref:CDP-alcohol phosphatidyltransferase n=1 Tax=Reyranella soli TaxID=1230389 RepID=A0A512NC54_9HYPH|nr:CDP-alcohol phosphatidyltransferase family protein [Reyranella soli]GEP56512.1 hypothetical protein RSO01_36780 [Reyranella soli]
MLDPLLRRWIDPSLNQAGAWLARRGLSADAVSLSGLAVGLVTVPLLAWQQYHAALLVILLNRLIDGLDGAIARHIGTTRFGGYLDIMCDMGFYAAVPVGFALARPDNALCVGGAAAGVLRLHGVIVPGPGCPRRTTR